MEEKARIIQELVPGKQVTIAHLIAHPDEDLAKKMGVPGADRRRLRYKSRFRPDRICGSLHRRTGHSGLRSQRGRSLTLYGKSPSRRTGLCRM